MVLLAVGSRYAEGRRRIRARALERPRAVWLLLWLFIGLTAGPVYLVVAVFAGWAGLSGSALTALGWAVGVGGGLLCFAPGELADIPVRLLGLTRGRGRLAAGAVCGFGAVQWFLPAPVLMPVTGGLPLLCLDWLISTTVFVAAASLLLPGRAARSAAGAAVLIGLLAWMPLRQLLISSADAAALHHFGGPPRDLVRVVDWPGTDPYFDSYRDGTMTTEYDYPALIPGPGGDYATMTVRRADPSDPCAVLLATVADGGPVPTCRSLGAGLWSTDDCALALESEGFLIQLVGSDCVPGEEGMMESVIRTQRPAGDLDVLGIGG